MKYLKLFEELSPSLAKRAAKEARQKQGYNDEVSLGDPLEFKKRRHQSNTFSSYISPEVKEKLREYGFGYHHADGDHYLSWSKDRVDDWTNDGTITILVSPTRYEIIKGDIQVMDEPTQRKLIRVIKWLQDQIK